MDYDDPGWRRSIKDVLWPFTILRRTRREGVNPIASARMIFLGVLLALLLFVFVLSQILPGDPEFTRGNRALVIVAVMAIGFICLVGVWSLRRKPLDASSTGNLIGSYRSMLFIGLGVSEAPALAGFVGAILTRSLWIYLVGLAFSLLAFLLITPSKREIARRQEQIIRQGSPLSLGKALTEGDPRSPSV